ncbi:Glutamate racemase [Vibrio quintilis]|uniref:Glutamate racemase n=2 Tax=Vibrio quintilis TaxID=1117707 RepID=A0A1M7YXA5_9VIBR|nr:Glutamate racemase [Vibrio quintilis]
MGGLSVYQEIYQLLPQHNYIYLFDNQAYPYGELSSSVLLERVESLIRHIVQSHDIDIVIIACNTASTIVLPSLRSMLSIPVVGVVPAIKPACLIAKYCVGLIATPATVKRDYTSELISNFSSGKEVIRLGTTELVDIAERKMRGEVIEIAEVQNVLQPIVNQIDVAVLGCTHFPLLRQEIQIVLGKNTLLVDSGYAIAKRVKLLLQDGASRHCRKPLLMYASAIPDNQVALSRTVRQFGFNQIQQLLMT